MTEEERLLLIEEAEKINIEEESTYFNFKKVLKPIVLDYKICFKIKLEIFDIPLLTELKDEKLAKKILIKNKYGILGNLLYKYRNDLDDELLEEFKVKDIELFCSNFYYSHNLTLKKIINLTKNFSKENQAKLRNNKIMILNLLKITSPEEILEFMSDELKKDADIAHAFFKHYENFDYIDTSLKNNKKFILNIINECIEPNWRYNDYKRDQLIKKVYCFMSEGLKEDKDIVYKLIESGRFSLTEFNPIFKNNKDIVMCAINNNPKEILYTSDKFKNDEEVMLKVVSKDGLLLQYASEELRNNKKVVIKALRNNSESLNFASDKLKNNKSILKTALNKGYPFSLINNDLKNDQELAQISLKKDPASFIYLGDDLKNNKDFILDRIKENSKIFLYIPDNLKNDINYLLELIQKNVILIYYIDDDSINKIEELMIKDDKIGSNEVIKKFVNSYKDYVKSSMIFYDNDPYDDYY